MAKKVKDVYMVVGFVEDTDEGTCEALGDLPTCREVFTTMVKTGREGVDFFLVKVIDEGISLGATGNAKDTGVEVEGEECVIIDPPEFKPENSRFCASEKSCC